MVDFHISCLKFEIDINDLFYEHLLFVILLGHKEGNLASKPPNTTSYSKQVVKRKLSSPKVKGSLW